MLTGIVFCGGKSLRMGRDKGLLKKGFITWAESAFQKLECLGIKVMLSVNETQLETYRHIFPEEFLIIDKPSSVFNLEGPLKGLLSVHQQLPQSDLFILACDMTDISIPLLWKLKNAFLVDQLNYDHFTYTNEGNYEPMCAIYGSRKLDEINKTALNHQLKVFSMKQILFTGKTLGIPVDKSEAAFFTNYNEKINVQQMSVEQ